MTHSPSPPSRALTRYLTSPNGSKRPSSRSRERTGPARNLRPAKDFEKGAENSAGDQLRAPSASRIWLRKAALRRRRAASDRRPAARAPQTERRGVCTSRARAASRTGRAGSSRVESARVGIGPGGARGSRCSARPRRPQLAGETSEAGLNPRGGAARRCGQAEEQRQAEAENLRRNVGKRRSLREGGEERPGKAEGKPAEVGGARARGGVSKGVAAPEVLSSTAIRPCYRR